MILNLSTFLNKTMITNYNTLQFITTFSIINFPTFFLFSFFNILLLLCLLSLINNNMMMAFVLLLILPLITLFYIIMYYYLVLTCNKSNIFKVELNFVSGLKYILSLFMFNYTIIYIHLYLFLTYNKLTFVNYLLAKGFSFLFVWYISYPNYFNFFFNYEILDTTLFNSNLFFFNSLPLVFIFNIDTLGILFMGLSGLLIFLCLIFLWPTFNVDKNIILYISQLLLLLIQLQITFTTNNLLTFFVAFESLLIPMIILISLWGSPNKRQANNYLVFYTLISAIPMLLAILYIYNCYGNLNIVYLKNCASWTWTEQLLLWLAFFFAFAVKTPMVPVHIWLLKAHVDAPTVGSVILAGVLLKIGLIGFIRITIPLFPEITHFFAPYISAIATVGVFYASCITLRQIDMKRIIAYSSVAHMNMALVSLCSLNPLGLYSCIYLMLSHGLIASGLFFIIGFLYNRFHIRIISYYSGLATIMPVFTICFFLLSLANMAFPFTSGFIGEFLLLLSIMSNNWFLGVLNLLSLLITPIYTLLLFNRLCLGELKIQFQNLVATAYFLHTTPATSPSTAYNFSIFDLTYLEFFIMVVLLVLIFFLGVYPQYILNLLIHSSSLYTIVLYFFI